VTTGLYIKHLDGRWAVDVSELGQKVEPVGGLTALGLEGPGDDDGSQEQEVKGEGCTEDPPEVSSG
jgi:hypothetical protein